MSLKQLFAWSPQPIFVLNRLVDELSPQFDNNAPLEISPYYFDRRFNSWHLANIRPALKAELRIDEQGPQTANALSFFSQKLDEIKQTLQREIRAHPHLTSICESFAQVERVEYATLPLLLTLYSELRNGFYDLLPGLVLQYLRTGRKSPCVCVSYATCEPTSHAYTGPNARPGALEVKNLRFFGGDGASVGPLAFQDSAPQQVDALATIMAQGFYSDKASAYSLVVPVYESYLDGIGRGGVCSCLLFDFDQEEKRDHFIRERLHDVHRRCEVISAELYSSALATLSTLRFDGINLIMRFLQGATLLHTWGRIRFSRVASSNETVFVRERRSPTGWKRFERTQPEQIETASVRGTELVLDWTSGQFWDIDAMPALTESEAHYLGCRFHFEYDVGCVVPDGKERARFEDAITARQHEVMRIALPGYRLEKKAIGNAVSAIMGRNMSHNIGSHVISRFAQDLDRWALPPGQKSRRADARAEFLLFLQQRMDFLASVATSAAPIGWRAMRLADVLNVFNLTVTRSRGGDTAPVSSLRSMPTTESGLAGSIMLNYISGKAGLGATVEYSGDKVFFCPDGEVGAHALYIVFENILRNAARHGRPSDDGILRLDVTAEDDGELLRLDIVDPQSHPADASGFDQVFRAGNAMRRSHGILDEDGSPSPRYWGLREMQICAHLLRGFSTRTIGSDGHVEKPVISASTCAAGLKYTLYLRRPRLLAIANPVAPTAQPTAMGIIRIVPQKGDESPQQYRERVVRQAGSFEFAVLPGMTDADYAVVASRLPVRTLRPSASEMASLEHCIAAETPIDPELLLAHLHRMMAMEYRSRRSDWRSADTGFRMLHFYDDAVTRPHDDAVWYSLPIGSGLSMPSSPAPWSLGIGLIDHATAKDMESSLMWESFADDRASQDGETLIFAQPVFSGWPELEALQQPACTAELQAAACARVMIVDERLQASLERRAPRSDWTYRQLWLAMGVWCPPASAADLNALDFNDTSAGGALERALQAIRDCYQKAAPFPGCVAAQAPPDFVIVHLTLLEKFSALERRSGDVSRAFRTLSPDLDDHPAPVRIAISGRGISAGAYRPPSAVTEGGNARSAADFRYLPYSSILRALVTQPSKLGLMRELWAAGNAGEGSRIA